MSRFTVSDNIGYHSGPYLYIYNSLANKIVIACLIVILIFAVYKLIKIIAKK